MVIDRYIRQVCSKIVYGTLNLGVKGKKYHFQGSQEGPTVLLTVRKLSMIWDLYFRGSVGLGEAFRFNMFEPARTNVLQGTKVCNSSFGIYGMSTNPNKLQQE